jgi:SAM-dependent MidA family methyltransferase
MLNELPTPSADALTHSKVLADLIRQHIVDAGGWIGFAEYMELSLYAPGLGYYSAGAAKFGEAGDFVTAPEVSPLFSRCLAGQCAEVLAELGGGTILELGAGTGIMAADLLLELDQLHMLPERYLILELGADLRSRQQQTLEQRVPGLIDRVAWLDRTPDVPRPSIVLANEVVDALPVERFQVTPDGIAELGVIADGAGFRFAARSASTALAAALEDLQSRLGHSLPPGFTSEICLRLPPWLAETARWLDRGMLLFIDYGLPRDEYYLRERDSGTLCCHYRHRAHDDPFVWPGLQDITAWVEFSRLADAAEEAGLHVAAYTTQAQFLIAAGLDRQLQRQPDGDLANQVEQAAGARRLVLPGEMGESFKVMALTRGELDVPSGFAGKDLRRTL